LFSIRAARDQAGNWRDTWNQFCDQARALGLKLRDVQGDGNCLFRAFADQLDGDQARHDYYRQLAVDYMHANPDDFAPFVDGDFAAYCKRMRKDAEWGGNVELQALSQTCMVNVTIHQLGDPFMEMINFDVDGTVMVHVRCDLG
jgi:OTU domain-containing protein 3